MGMTYEYEEGMSENVYDLFTRADLMVMFGLVEKADPSVCINDAVSVSIGRTSVAELTETLKSVIKVTETAKNTTHSDYAINITFSIPPLNNLKYEYTITDPYKDSTIPEFICHVPLAGFGFPYITKK